MQPCGLSRFFVKRHAAVSLYSTILLRPKSSSMLQKESKLTMYFEVVEYLCEAVYNDEEITETDAEIMRLTQQPTTLLSTTAN